MGVLDAFRKRTAGEELYECRNCGQKFSVDVEECPNCHWQEIAHYEF